MRLRFAGVPSQEDIFGGSEPYSDDRIERAIVLDLARVSSIDAAGIGEWLHAHNMAVAMGAELRAVHATTGLSELLERAGLYDHLAP